MKVRTKFRKIYKVQVEPAQTFPKPDSIKDGTLTFRGNHKPNSNRSHSKIKVLSRLATWNLRPSAALLPVRELPRLATTKAVRIRQLSNPPKPLHQLQLKPRGKLATVATHAVLSSTVSALPLDTTALRIAATVTRVRTTPYSRA